MDGQALEGLTNQQAVEVLRHTGPVVRLKLARYKYGPKFEQLVRCATRTYLPRSNSIVISSSPDLVVCTYPDLVV